MSQSTYPFGGERDNESELSFDQFTFEELKDPELGEDRERHQEASGGEGDLVLDEYISNYKREPEQTSDIVANEKVQVTEVPIQTPLQLVQSRLTLVRQALGEMKEKIDKAIELVEAELPRGDTTDSLVPPLNFAHREPTAILREGSAGTDRILEGVFDGQNMVGSDGNRYAIPQNYASKSKIVEGDALKLTITERGSFIYKQIGPVERTRVVGYLQHDMSSNLYYVRKDSKRWAVLSASVTYFRGTEGDEAVIMVPRDYASSWGAVENIIKRG